MGKTQSLESLHHVTPVWISAQAAGSSHQIVAAGDSVVRSANCPCTKSDSTQWCQEAAAYTEVRPCEHGKTARANTEKADGVYRHRHVNKKGHGVPNRTT